MVVSRKSKSKKKSKCTFKYKSVSRKTKKQKGGSQTLITPEPTLTISYPKYGILKHKDDLTNNIIYNKEPTVIFNNALQNHTYLVTLTDPDAPNGFEIDKSITAPNHTYTHWVYTYTYSNTNSSITNQVSTIVPYTPPRPPKGTHRYVFKIYDLPPDMVSSLKMDMNIDTNSNYYVNKLKKLRKYQTKFIFYYTVKSNVA
uniref:Phosphatidylethanolamine-binding protein n=1 Tax=viral metagenome TaxID=1070528 RepID=A0A6C0F0G9_9ZZZZ